MTTRSITFEQWIDIGDSNLSIANIGLRPKHVK